MRLFRRRVEENAVPLDMTPMIDCIFLLLIFFILTTKFYPDEKQLAVLMPTDQGSLRKQESPPPVMTELIRVAIVPDGAPAWASDHELDAWVKTARQPGESFTQAELRIGGHAPFPLDLVALADRRTADAALAEVHAYVASALDRLELGSTARNAAPPIEIHCYSALPWTAAMVAYDAVRAYEGERYAANAAEIVSGDARTVNFAPPRVRHFSALEAGKELAEILRIRN